MSKQRSPSDIFRLGFHEPYLRAKDGPFIKLLNWYTGFGKTYTAAGFAVKLRRECDVIPVFIAPLQSIVAGFSGEIGKHLSEVYADDVEAEVRRQGETIPIHRLYSIEYQLNDRKFFEAALAFGAWVRAHREMFASERDTRGDPSSSLDAKLAELTGKAKTCKDSTFWNLSPSDDMFEDTKEAYLKAARRAHDLAERLTKQVIVRDINSRERFAAGPLYLKEPPVAEMVRRLHPLQAFLDDPGIIITTASKAQVQQHVYIYDEEKGSYGWSKFDNLPLFLKELNRDGSTLGRLVSQRPDSARVVTFVDEEEDSYWYLFDQRKSVVNSEGRNDLNLVISEFFTYFDLKWPLAFDGDLGAGLQLASKVYEYLEHFAEVAKAVDDEFVIERKRTGAAFIPDFRRVAILRKALEERSKSVAESFDNGELLLVLQQLHDRNDAHKAFKRFRQKARVLALLRKYIEGVTPKRRSNYERFRTIQDLVCDKKYFTMSRATYGEVLDQPGQTFFTETASVMATDFLKQVELCPDTGRQTVRLRYYEREVPEHAYTLLHYLELVLFMARVLVKDSGEDAIEFSKDDRDRYRELYRFRNDVRRLFKDKVASEGVQQQTSSDELLTEAFFFDSTKSVVTLEESRRQAEEYNRPADVCLTLTITSLRASPEEDIADALGRSNGIYLMSATGGLVSASTGAFNIPQLRRALEAKDGYFSEMTEAELEVVAADAREKMKVRGRKVVILDDAHPSNGFAVSDGFKGLLDAFKKEIPKKEEYGYAPLNRHKEHELEGLVASLDALLSNSMRSGLVLCQTTQHIKKCLQRLANSSDGFVRQDDMTGDLYTIRPSRLPFYRKNGSKDEIRLVLYSAARFRKKDSTKVGAIEESDDSGQFSEDLESALDVTSRKVLLWSAYGSASRGINFNTLQNGVKRDFELFCLLNDPYYTRHTRPGTRGFSMEMFQGFVQVLRDENEAWAAMSRRELLYQYSRNRWKRLRKEHYIDVTRTVFQALGRGERRPHEPMDEQRIYMSSEAARNIHLGLRHAPELRVRASPAQHSVLDEIDRRNEERALFATEADRREHGINSLALAVDFRGVTSELPKRFRSDESARSTWTAIFDSLMFSDPQKYLAKLERHGVPTAFVQGCYLEVSAHADLYTKEKSMAGVSELVITDSFDGTDKYEWASMVAPASLVVNLSSETRTLLRKARGVEFENEQGRRRLVPQPWFVTEIMKGYIAELELEAYIKMQFGVAKQELAGFGDGALRYLALENHPLVAALYQLYDYYLEVGQDVLIAVDVKNWARSTDHMKREELQHEAEIKHERLSALLPDRTIHAVYVNLYGAHKLTIKGPMKGSIRFMSLYVQKTNSQDGWMPNDNLAAALLGEFGA